MSDIMKKVNDKDEVAVLVSYGYGAGWYSWNNNLEMLYDPEIVDYVLDIDEQGFDDYTKEKMIIDKFQSKYPDAYMGGADGLTVVWIPKGTNFRIVEYDGNEKLEYNYDVSWIVA